MRKKDAKMSKKGEAKVCRTMEVKAARCALMGEAEVENRSDGFGGEGCGNRTGLEGVERSGDMVRESQESCTQKN